MGSSGPGKEERHEETVYRDRYPAVSRRLRRAEPARAAAGEQGGRKVKAGHTDTPGVPNPGGVLLCGATPFAVTKVYDKRLYQKSGSVYRAK